jgi:hypothetical protein
MKRVFTILALSFLFFSAYPQEAVTESDTIRKDALNVYFPDADSYIKKEINFINYVRDLKEADVYIIVAEEEAGSGGELYTVFMVGQHKFAGMNDTLMVASSPDETEDVFRKKAVSALKMGFMRYMLKTPLSQLFDIRFTVPVKETVETDKWNNWVFRTSLSGSLNGQRSYKSTNLHGSVSINRVIEQSKFQTHINYNWSKDKYQMNDSTYMSSFNNSEGLSVYYVKSLNDHWSTGFSTGMSRSSFGYYDFQYRIAPAIEYDIFPYSESTRRQLRIYYEAGYRYYDYSDTTIYNKVTEHLAYHELSASWEVVQKWGSVDLTVQWSNYLHDWSKNNLGAYLHLSVRVFKGMNINFSGSGSMVNDQLSLPKGGVSDFDIITRNRMTQTKFNYFGYFGFSYTFGSIYNNAVNPRFGW